MSTLAFLVSICSSKIFMFLVRKFIIYKLANLDLIHKEQII